LKRVANNKRSNLFGLFGSGEEKQFCKNDQMAVTFFRRGKTSWFPGLKLEYAEKAYMAPSAVEKQSEQQCLTPATLSSLV
jgi:hypothetical protein